MQVATVYEWSAIPSFFHKQLSVNGGGRVVDSRDDIIANMKRDFSLVMR
jgi:hypothetical protein